MSPTLDPAGPSRVWFGPAGGELIGQAVDGAPVTADLECGVGPMTDLTPHLTDIHFSPREPA